MLVVGSKRMSNADVSDSSGDERVFWEYTPKAVRLVAAYKNAFPNLFAALSKAPDERFYDSKKVFGPKGDEMCAKVLEWLKGVETAAMPRLPQTTDAMPVAAVHAVQRAADVRSSTQASQPWCSPVGVADELLSSLPVALRLLSRTKN